MSTDADPPTETNSPTETRPAAAPSARGLAPVAGVLLLAITVVLAGGVVTAAIDAPAEPAPTASLSLSATDDRIAVTHRGGDALDASELDVRVRVDGEPLARQPPVPFFSAAGFHPGPTGAFNAATDGDWRVGGSASFRVAGTNDPTLEPGRTVTVEVSVGGRPVATLETIVESG
ncbi:type IV pilin N-terminal domain-containing protein [Halorubrum sp. CSM-61]|uniref:type IV pilin N-terminal domain-containing protein n=1 Tax=Halorubrum sp. CSM-61 TaxID=2485838 RepID=UPI000F4C21EE|nr:type IV pilin N-terminal domain-containing protein [Halorubrum sp. CSM-61]